MPFVIWYKVRQKKIVGDNIVSVNLYSFYRIKSSKEECEWRFYYFG